MNIKNNIIDSKNSSSDEAKYAVNINLKSGETIHLEGLKKGEIDGYIDYTKNGSDEVMIIEVDGNIWRIEQGDIERLAIDKYSKNSFKNSVVTKFILARSYLGLNPFIRIIKLMIIAIIAVFLNAGVKIFTSGRLIDILMNENKLMPFIDEALANSNIIFAAVLILLIVLHMFDFITPPKREYYIIDDEYALLQESRLSNIISTLVFIAIYFLAMFLLKKIIMMIF